MTRDEAKAVVESMTDEEVLALCALLDMWESKTKEVALHD